jgi:ATP-dependent Clp protease ATP-binding subunit ClpA
VKWGKYPLAPLPPPIRKKIEEIELAEPVRKLLGEKEAKIKELEKELAQMKDEKKRLEAERAIEEEKSKLIDTLKERRWQLNGLLKLNERWYKDGKIHAQEYMQNKKNFERELKKLEEKVKKKIATV